MRLGIIGAGSIVPAHIRAAKIAGFSTVAICGKDYSERAMQLAKQTTGLSFFPNIEKLLEVDLDALLIAVTPESTISCLIQCLSKDIPILVEKPVATSTSAFDLIEEEYYSKILVGFNRRHYSSTQRYKSELEKTDCGLIQVNIPELSWKRFSEPALQQKMLCENSVHMFDLIQYLFGRLDELNILAIEKCFQSRFRVVNFKTQLGFIGTLSIGFGVPDNLSIKSWSHGEVMELNPIESFQKFTEIHIEREQSQDAIKKYVKIDSSDWKIEKNDLIAKPGFVNQYLDFAKRIRNESNDDVSANIWDAKSAIAIAEQLASFE